MASSLRTRLALVPLVGAVLSASCGQSDDPQTIIVSAASSLIDVLTEIGTNFERTHSGATVQFNFASSGALKKQIENGAPADIFVSASPAEMDALQGQGLIDTPSRFDFAANTLVLIGPPASPAHDWSGILTAKRIAIANPETAPVGRYARAALQHRGLWKEIASKLVFAENARQTLAYVTRGDVDLAIAFETDLRIARGRAKLVAAAEEGKDHEPIRYPAARLKGACPDADKFLEYLKSAEATAVLRQHGFADVR